LEIKCETIDKLLIGMRVTQEDSRFDGYGALKPPCVALLERPSAHRAARPLDLAIAFAADECHFKSENSRE
jgi:hypothetical protein